MINNFLKKITNFFGFDIIRINNEIKNISFDEILQRRLLNNPIIFDVGANQGQSIERFSKLFSNFTIHSFEPIAEEFDKLKNKFGNINNIYLNNFALGEKEEKKGFYVAAKSETSSFNKINSGTDWLKKRSKDFNTSEKQYTKYAMVNIKTLDNYCKKNNINKIDILKIDTQGYEDKVLEGSLEAIKKNQIGIVITEIIFDDVYDKYFNFSDLEKFLIPYNFRMVGINLINNNIFSGLVFSADVMYFNKKHHNI